MKQLKRIFLARAAMTLLLAMLMTMTVWAQDVTIGTSDEWNTFAEAVSNGTTYEGQTVSLTADITITKMAGTSDHKFKGTFLGNDKTLTVNLNASTDNCAPFGYIDGATIKDLKIAGSITTSKKFAASLAAHTYGETNITNCHSTVAITGNNSGDGTHGGFVAVNEGSATLNFNGCSFKGSMLGSNATSNGGFVGYNGGTIINYTDCLFAPAGITMSATSSSTFNRNDKNSFTRTYYTQAFGTAEGMLVYTTAPQGADTEQLTAADGQTYYYTIDRRIASADDWNNFAQDVNSGTTFSGKIVVLGADISVTTMAGTSSHKFKGTFEGGGHTITFNVTNAPEHTALFAYVDGATIQNLTVAGAISSTTGHIATLISEPSGTVRVTDVKISADISGTTYCGGFSTGGAGIQFTRCVYNGKINVAENSGGFCGWGTDATTLTDCLFAPADGSSISGGGNFCNNSVGTVTRSYYTLKVGTSTQGKQAYTAAPDNSVCNSLTIAGVTVWLPVTISGVRSLYIATGSNIHPEPTVTAADGTVLTKGTHYNVAYSSDNDKDVGNYTLTVTGISPYSGSEVISYEVNNVNLNITSEEEWNQFATNVNNGVDYFGMTVTLGNNISVSTMAGTSDYKFKGTFLGDGHTLTVNYTATADDCAPFLYIDGATIKYLKVTGTISTSKKYAAGIAAHSYGTSTIQNCWSNVAITSSVNGDATHAGLVAVLDGGSLTVSSSLFDGSITGSSTNNCGGLVGWRNATLTFNNCMMAGTMAIKQTNSSALFNRNGSSTLTNCYYDGSKSYGSITTQGTSTTATGEALKAQLGSKWEVSDDKAVPIISFRNLTYATVSGVNMNYFYTGSAISITPVVTDADGTTLTPGTDYTVTIKKGDDVVTSITAEGDYTLTITGTGTQGNGYYGSKSVTFNVVEVLSGSGTKSSPYLIGSIADWTRFANADCADIYWASNVYVKLTADIAVTTMAGTSDHKFKGTFYGGGHTLTVNYTATANDCAPFLYIDGATIKCLKVTGTISTNYKYAAGIAAHSYGTSTIQNCWSNVAISSTVNGDATHAGIVAVQEDGSLNITNCLFDGSITGSSTTNCGGLLGWRNGTLTFNNCMMAGTMAISQTDGSSIFSRNGNPTLSNCYYDGSKNYGSITVQGTATTDTGSALQTNLGSGWTVSGNKAVPIMDAMNLATATVSGMTDYYQYTGNPIDIPYTITAADGTVLTKGTHYTETFSPATVQEKGNYTLTISGKGGYSGTLTFSFSVVDGYTYYEEGIKKTKPASEVTVINSSNMPTSLNGWYIVTENVSYTSVIRLTGTTHLILADGVTMTASNNDFYGTLTHSKGSSGQFYNSSLYLYGQAKDTGKLKVTGQRAFWCQHFYKYGGVLEASGTQRAILAGLATGTKGTVNIIGGKTTLTGGVTNVSNILLSWTREDNEIYGSNWDGTVTIASGKSFWNKDTENVITSDFNGKTLVPAGSRTVSTAATEHGSIETDRTHAIEGSTVTITATPDDGYGVGAVSVVDADNGAVPVTFAGNGQYTFTMPAKSVTANAAFVQMSNDFGNVVITNVNDDYIRTGSAISVTPTVTLLGHGLTSGTDYTVSYTRNGSPATEVRETGEYELTVSPATGSSYTGSKSKTFRVLDFTSAAISDIKPVYRNTGAVRSDITPTVTLTGMTLSETLTATTDYTVSYTRNGSSVGSIKEPGNYTMTVTGAGTYAACGSTSTDFTVLAFEQYDTGSKQLVAATTPDDNASLVTATTTGMATGWHVVKEDVTVNSRIWVNGDVNLVLCDGATLTAGQGIEVRSGKSLTIYSQNGNTGALTAYGFGTYVSAIGANDMNISAGTITIHGGEINATSRGDGAVAIGRGDCTVNIYGGRISASYDMNGHGIGSGTVNLSWCRTTDYVYAKSYGGTVNLLNYFVLDDNRQQVATAGNIDGKRIVPQGSGWFVYFNSQGGSAVAQQTIANNATATEPTPTRTGYTFGGWYTDADCTDGNAYDFSAAVTANLMLYAKWTLTPFAITLPEGFEATVGGSTATTATMGQTVTLTLKSGYTLTGSITATDANSQTVSLTDEGNGTYTFTMPASAVNVVAFAGSIEPGWTLAGTYKTQNFTADDTYYYGFVGTDGTGTELGTFVRVGGYVRVKPMRAYLVAPGGTPQNAPARRTSNSEQTPTSLRVRLLGSNGKVTSLSEDLSVKSEEFAPATEWYDLQGRKLSGKPTQRGIYINNGKKVVIK